MKNYPPTCRTEAELRGLPPTRWLIKGLLPSEGVASICGPSASGKSFLVLDAMLHVARGRPWFGHKVPRAVPVVYVAMEGEAGIRRRLQAWTKGAGLVPKVPDNFRVIYDYPLDLCDPDNVKALGDAVVAELGQGVVVVIDTLARSMSGDENSSDMSAAMGGAKNLQRQVGGLSLVIHHTGKDATRGNSSFYAALDAVIEVQRWDQGGVPLRQWRVAKSKDGEDGAARMFELKVAELGTDEDGDPITSCYVAPDESAVATLAQLEHAAGSKGLGGNQATVLEAVTLALSGLEAGLGLDREAALQVAIAALQTEGLDQRRARARAGEALKALVGRRLLRQVVDKICLPSS